MLQRIKAQRNLTVLITTHYMDEADKLCDRIAIVDHGKLVALDSPLKLKASIPGQNVLESSFANAPGRLGGARHGTLPLVDRSMRTDHIFRISRATDRHDAGADGRGGRGGTSGAVAVGAEHDARRCVRALHGQALRDALQEASPQTVPFMIGRASHAEMWAIVERELRRFRRSPMLIVDAMIFPLGQLVILGYAFGGNVKHLKVAVVDQDHGCRPCGSVSWRQAASSGARTSI
jgi:hypothetical protein